MKKNIINRLTLKVMSPEENPEKANFKRYEEFVDHDIIPILDHALEKFSQYNLIIDKVEIDLGVVSRDSIPIILDQKLTQILIEEIELVQVGKDRIMEGLPSAFYNNDETPLRIFTYYLRTGLLPWYSAAYERDLHFSQTTGQIDMNKLLIYLIDNKGEELINLLQSKFTNAELLERFRFLLESDKQLMAKVFELYAKKGDDEPGLWIWKLFVKINKEKLDVSAIEDQLHRLIFDYYFGNLKLSSVNEFVKILFDRIGVQVEKQGTDIIFQFSPLQTFVLDTKTLYNEQLFVEKVLDLLKRYSVMAIQEKTKIGSNNDSDASLSKEIATDDLLDLNIIGEKTSRILVPNAGLILFGPFLVNVFSRLGYIDHNNLWKNLACQISAVHLLHYIAFKDEKSQENLMLLNKILVSWPIYRPIPLKHKLSDDEKDEAEQLIMALIDHWKALKNTSPEGFRSSFIQRKGLVEQSQEGFVLRVESKTYDLLLEHLPWSFTMIKLPWVKNLINTEWNYK